MVRTPNEARGSARGSKRGKEAQARRRKVRYDQPRVRDRVEDVRRSQEALEARIEHEKRHPVMGAVEGAAYSNDWRHEDVVTEVPDTKVGLDGKVTERKVPVRTVVRMRVPAEKAQGTEWTLLQARAVLRQGYSLRHTMHLTGWGSFWFDDLKVDRHGFLVGE